MREPGRISKGTVESVRYMKTSGPFRGVSGSVNIRANRTQAETDAQRERIRRTIELMEQAGADRNRIQEYRDMLGEVGSRIMRGLSATNRRTDSSPEYRAMLISRNRLNRR